MISGLTGQYVSRYTTGPRGGGCSGFVIAATHMPGAYEDFARLVVPELQRRGLFQRKYEGNTLRERLGLNLTVHGEL